MDIRERDDFADGKCSQIECLFFDLDDTLYPLSSGIAPLCRQNILDFMVEKLGIDAATAPDLCSELYRKYGTSMAGLVASGYKFDFDEYHRFVHGRLPYHILHPDLVLKNLLLSMPQRKLVFTNGDKVHAFKVLSKLGLEDCFEHVLCFESFNPKDNFHSSLPIVCKPSLEVFHRAVQLAGVDPSKTLFFDDSHRNIKGAKAIGLQTVLVGSSTRVEGADHAIESIHNIREAIPEIWQEQDVIFSSSTVPMEAIVVAA